ncbi:hypothetical protein NDU88_001324 [Pleurodeles waltl]|uniref:Uncharacterized protein n=1 Tax=Pleurodeles waltl TaxID=8319 RepID=A0AAV7WM39_PLEWA|nr:hypothetical protein NDU88_001324 [Pleurodeles waltl]
MLARELRSRPENILVVLPAQTAPVTAIVNRAIPVPGEQAAGVRTACGLLAAGADKEEPRGLAGRGASCTEEAPPAAGGAHVGTHQRLRT